MQKTNKTAVGPGSVLIQNKPQSSFVLRCCPCPRCKSKLDLKKLTECVCPKCGAALPYANEIKWLQSEEERKPVPKKKKKKSNPAVNLAKEKKEVIEQLIPGVEVGTFVFVGFSDREYMVIEVGEGQYYALEVVPDDECPQDQFVQRAYRDRAVLIEQPAAVVFPSQIRKTKARLAKQIVEVILKNHYKLFGGKSSNGDQRKTNEKREKKGDGLYVGNPWEGLSMTTHHVKVYKG